MVIQIPVTSTVEKLPTMTPEKAMSLNITSRSEDSPSNNNKDLNSVDTASLSGKQSPSPTENCCTREVKFCDKEMIEEKKEKRNFANSDEESESSLGDRIRLNPTPSALDGKSDDYETESLKDCATDDQREVSTTPRHARLAEHGSISIKCDDRSGAKHSRHRRSHKDSSKRHCGGASYVKDASRTPDPGCGKKFCSPRRSSHRNSKQELAEWKGVRNYREKCHGGLYSTVDHARLKEHRFGRRNNRESSLGQGFDHSNSYKCEGRLKEYNSRSSFNLNERNSRSSFKEENDRYGWDRCERKYGHERSPIRPFRKRDDWLGEPYYEDYIPITDMDYRYQSEYSSASVIHNHKQSPENDRHCRRRGDYDYNRHRYEDECQREPFDMAYREMRSFAGVKRRGYQGCKRREDFFEIERKHHYTHDWHLDRFVSEEDGYKYRTQKAWPSPSLSSRDSWHTKVANDDLRREYTRDFRPAKAYESQNNQFRKAALRDGWTRNLGRTDNVSIKDRRKNYDDLDQGRYKFAGDTQCSMREDTNSEILSSNTRIPMATNQRSGYSKSHIHENDERHHSSKKLRGSGDAFGKSQDPVDLAGRQGKLSNEKDRIEQQQDVEKPVQIQDITEKEEGEIIEETNEKSVEIDNEHIEEERLKKIEEVTLECQAEERAITGVTNQQRPIKKRRWCTN